ncbi:MAG: histidine triad nucleotide-binding protein [Planctomycetes bacterium]|nr:histidine triad nucleotide-binding protein [Planctomycetota bacterium]
MSENCLFCKIIKREIPSDIVFEDDDVICFKDINPQAPIHLLLIPKKHIPTMNDITDADFALMGRLSGKIQKIAKQEGFDEKGYRTVINTNKAAGQVVWHTHYHILAGKDRFGWNPA